jgi:hypothetical protein
MNARECYKLFFGTCGKRSESGNLLKVGGRGEYPGANGDFCKINKDLRVLTESYIARQEEITGIIRERPNAFSHLFHRPELALREKSSPKC